MLTYHDTSRLTASLDTLQDYWYALADCKAHDAQCRAVERELARVRWLSMDPSMVASDAHTRVGGGAL